jgi:hypothetical protein
MKEEEFPTLKGEEEMYVLKLSDAPVNKKISVQEYLMNSGELVTGVGFYHKDTVKRYLDRDGDTYMGVGIYHRKDPVNK